MKVAGMYASTEPLKPHRAVGFLGARMRWEPRNTTSGGSIAHLQSRQQVAFFQQKALISTRLDPLSRDRWAVVSIAKNSKRAV